MYEDLAIPVLVECASAPEGWVSQKQLIEKVSAKVIDFLRARHGKRTIFGRGFALYTRDGLGDGVRITPAGRAFLQSIPSHRAASGPA